ncbi:MAG TPA: sugar phosphate nucleotidyltransferase, partial [Chitinophagales bacterium]|nr:sugar phosphate nucleotidyltransferase [Chitinophagales bacterium]
PFEPGRNMVIEYKNTGEETPSAGRIKLLEKKLAGHDNFVLTYCDIICDADIAAMHQHHVQLKAAATVMAVQVHEPFGVMDIKAERVTAFNEKPLMRHWINGGLFIVNKKALGYLKVQHSFEAESMPLLIGKNQLVAYKHRGAWLGVDTYKDLMLLRSRSETK